MPYTSTIRRDVEIEHKFPTGATIIYRGREYTISALVIDVLTDVPVYIMEGNKRFRVIAVDASARIKPAPPAIDLWVVCYRTEDDGINLVPCHSEEQMEGQRKFAPENYLHTFRLHPDGNWWWI